MLFFFCPGVGLGGFPDPGFFLFFFFSVFSVFVWPGEKNQKKTFFLTAFFFCFSVRGSLCGVFRIQVFSLFCFFFFCFFSFSFFSVFSCPGQKKTEKKKTFLTNKSVFSGFLFFLPSHPETDRKKTEFFFPSEFFLVFSFFFWRG